MDKAIPVASNSQQMPQPMLTPPIKDDTQDEDHRHRTEPELHPDHDWIKYEPPDDQPSHSEDPSYQHDGSAYASTYCPTDTSSVPEFSTGGCLSGSVDSYNEWVDIKPTMVCLAFFLERIHRRNSCVFIP